jgi:hypothetical protein
MRGPHTYTSIPVGGIFCGGIQAIHVTDCAWGGCFTCRAQGEGKYQDTDILDPPSLAHEVGVLMPK